MRQKLWAFCCCASSKLDLSEFIGGFDRLAIACGAGEAQRTIPEWPEAANHEPAPQIARNLSHIHGGNIATAYFRPQLAAELEFEDRLRAATRVVRFALGFAAERYSGGNRAGARSLDANTIADCASGEMTSERAERCVYNATVEVSGCRKACYARRNREQRLR
jgi:hypothetical protein